MKKLRLKALSLGAREILSREQLRSVTGGCMTSYDCDGGRGFCNALNECEGGGGSGGARSSAPDHATCPGDSYQCYCGLATIGCLTVGECEATVCLP